MKKIKYTGKENTRVSVQGKGKIEIKPGEIFKTSDEKARDLLRMYNDKFEEYEKPWWQENITWIISTILLFILNLLQIYFNHFYNK